MFPEMERLINRRQQGDLGEASAIEWLTRQGATVSAPLGHSPDYDLIAEFDGRVIRVQAKTSTLNEPTRDGRARWSVSIVTNGGNQSWTGVAKHFDPAKVDALFVIVGDGRRWFIPASDVEGRTAIRLGGRKYAEYEIEPGGAILDLVYARQEPAPGTGLESKLRPGEYPSGQRIAAVNRTPFWLRRFESCLPHSPSPAQPAEGERKLGHAGQTTIARRRQITLPHVPFAEAGLKLGDRLRFRADGLGRLVVERIEPPPGTAPARQAPDGRLVQPNH
jgi:hypothetical protein